MSRRRIFTGFMNQSSDPVSEFTDVLIIAGQSNALGNTGGVDPISPFVLPNQNAFIVGLNNNAGVEVSSFQQLNFANGTALGQSHGVELGFAYYYGLQNTNKTVYIVKVTQGSTKLGSDWSSNSLLRSKLIEYINVAKNEVPNPRFSFYWNQWESDLRNDSFSSNYESNYRAFIDDVLTQTGVTFENHIIQKANPNSLFSQGYPLNYPKVLTAQTNNASFYGADLLDSDNLPFHDDIHYSSSSYNQMGQDINNLIIE